MNAEEYKKKVAAKQIIEDLPLPSGGVFQMRVAPISIWTQTGILPASLAAKMQALAQTKNSKEANDYVLNHFAEQDFIDSQEMGRRMLRYCCIEPKVFIPDPKRPELEQSEDEILPEDILPEDFEAIMKWIWSGGEQGDRLAKFSRKPRQSSKPRANR